MSLQVAILKVLASYPDGRASLSAMKADLALLAGAGSEWSQRLKRLAANAPGLDIFSQNLVVRDRSGWALTETGRELLRSLDVAAPAKPKLKVIGGSGSSTSIVLPLMVTNTDRLRLVPVGNQTRTYR